VKVRVGVAGTVFVAVSVGVDVRVNVGVRVSVGVGVAVNVGAGVGPTTVAHPVKTTAASMPEGPVVSFMTSTRKQFVPAAELNVRLVAAPWNPVDGVEPICIPFMDTVALLSA